jgi:hypothetical protein
MTHKIHDENVITQPQPRRAEMSTAASLEVKFRRLVQEWKAQRGPTSSTTKLVMHPAYQKIIGMGPDVVPLLLAELERDPDVWFWALRSITEANPVTHSIHGDVKAMADVWLRWGREQGYQW